MNDESGNDAMRVWVLEKVNEVRDKFMEYVREANNRANRVLASIALVVGLLTVIGSYVGGLYAAQQAVTREFREKKVQEHINAMAVALEDLNTSGARLPVGTIIAVNGNKETIDRLTELGWAVCDGTSTTPDLTNVFLRGMSRDSSPEFGGAKKGNTSTGPVDNGVDLNKHQHETPLMMVSGGPHAAVGAPFGLGSSNRWPAEFNAHYNNGHAAPIASGGGSSFSGDQWQLTYTVFGGKGVDLNKHAHAIKLPPYYTVVFMMRVKMPEYNYPPPAPREPSES